MKMIIAFLLGATALAASAIGVSAADPYPGVLSARAPARAFDQVPPRRVVLYDQNNNPEGIAVVSQNFETDMDAYDSQGADDFVVPSGHKWVVSEVDVTGLYTGDGRASSENVFFYLNGPGLPSTLVKECDNLLGKPVGAGSFSILLPRGCRAKLGPGTYWVSVQINMNSSGGLWEWQKQISVEGNPAAWQNPGDGFGTGCTTWGVENTCWGLDTPTTPNGDKMFTLKGKDT